MTSPPRTAELLLAALGADADFRDAVLGDLAEEFTIRTAWDGIGAARRWYYREALRAAPHLLRNGLRRMRPRDVAHLAGLLVTSHVLVLVLAAFVAAMAGSVLATLGVAPGPQLHPGGGVTRLLLGLTVGAVTAVTGGYIAAWLNARAPLVSSLALGAVWACGNIAVLAAFGATPVWYRIAAPVLAICGTAVGGIVRVGVSQSQTSGAEGTS